MQVLGVLTDKENPYLINDDQVLINAFKVKEIELRPIIWDQDDWSSFDHILIRTPWDYSQKERDFIDRIIHFEKNGGILIHPGHIVLWNMDKAYLTELSQKKLPVIPTTVLDHFEYSDLKSLFNLYGKKIVLKPKIGAGGIDTFCLNINEDRIKVKNLLKRKVICQPFMESIIDQGEYSFIFLGKQFSHAVLKKPKPGEFRIQDDHGGSVESYIPKHEEVAQVMDFIKGLDFKPLYARIDVVKRNDRFFLMELELIEPELFWRFADEKSISTFSQLVSNQLT